MLETMRNAAQGMVGKAVMTVVMGLIIVSFVIWGVGDMLRGFTATTVATVGSEKITTLDFRDQFQRTLQQALGLNSGSNERSYCPGVRASHTHAGVIDCRQDMASWHFAGGNRPDFGEGWFSGLTWRRQDAARAVSFAPADISLRRTGEARAGSPAGRFRPGVG